MKEKNKKHFRRLRNLLILFFLTSVFISIATYAWFIGMKTVDVSAFDVEIATVDSLLLSLDGKNWSTTIDISRATLDDKSYAGHTNSWGGSGLIPLSTVGKMDTISSRMIIFEKASYSATAGGYRIMTSRVDNYTDLTSVPYGYLVFDLFIKNFSGRQYNEPLNILDEEAIYLTIDSAVTVSAAGVAGTGIENSVRVAFAPVARVHGSTTDANKITGVKCNDSGGSPSVVNGVTGICRNAAIWEPNDLDHVESAIKWYEVSCKGRTGSNVTLSSSYGGICNTVTDGVFYPTYPANSAISSGDNVDVYDGVYNGYPPNAKAALYNYFTDSMKLEKGVKRQEIFTLAPNSITKMRVYVYLEGQDIDNYDYAAIGKAISVKFGFTKERFVEDDVGYTGPPLGSSKTSKPEITLVPPTSMTIPLGGSYTEPGYSAYDAESDEDLTRKVQITNPVNTSIPGTYEILYMVSDWWGNYADVVYRTVTVSP